MTNSYLYATDSHTIVNTRTTTVFSLLINLVSLLGLRLFRESWHPILLVHVFAIFACAMFFTYATAWWRKDEWIPIRSQDMLSRGRGILVIASASASLAWILPMLLTAPYWESVRGTPAETAFMQTIVTIMICLYLLALGGIVAGIGLITSGLYDVQGPETPGNAQ